MLDLPCWVSVGHRGMDCAWLTHGPLPAIIEDLSDSDEVFAKEMTKWSSNDFLDTLERPAELDENLGEQDVFSLPKPSVGIPGWG